MAKKKSYHTIDELLEQQRQKAFSDFSVGDNKEYHTIDEIKKAATEQGLLTERAPATQPSAQTTSGRRNLMIRNNQIKNDSRQWKQNQVDGSNPFDLRNQVYKTQNETIPRIAQQAASDYVKNRMGYNYISQYGDDTRYSDVSNDINRVQQLKGGAARRGKDTEVYDRALDMLKDYAAYNRNLAETMTVDEVRAKKNESTDQKDQDRENYTWLANYNNGDIIAQDAKEGEQNRLKAEQLTRYFKDQYGIDNVSLENAVDFGSKSRRSDIAYFDEDGEAVTWDNYLRIKSAETKLNDISNNKDVNDIYSKNVTDYDDINQIDKAIDMVNLSFSDATDNNTPTISTDEQRAITAYLSDKYNIDFSKDVNDVLTDLNNVRAEVENQFESDRESLSQAGYDWEELNYYNQYVKDKEEYQRRKAENEQFATEHPVAATLSSIAVAPAKVFDLAQNVAESFKSNDADETSALGLSNIYNDYNVNTANQYTSKVSQNINESVKESTNSDVLAWLASNSYSGISSSAQSAMTNAACVAMFGPQAGEVVALGLMGTEAAADGFNNAVRNGSNNKEALFSALATGVNEVMFEKLSFDHLMKMKGNLDTKSLKGFVKSALKSSPEMLVQGLVEADEEVNTDIANTITDYIINGNHSEYNNSIERYISQGYSKEEAEKLASEDKWKQLLESAYGGFIGGATAGSGKVAVNTAKAAVNSVSNRAERNQYIRNVGEDVTGAGNAQALLDRAAQIDDPAVKAQVQRTQQALDKANQNSTKSTNNRLSRETGKLYAAMQDSTAQGIQNAKANEIKAAIKSAYAAETGETDSSVISKAADAIYKSEYTDERLTRSERNLAETAAAQSALESVKNNPDLIESATQKAQERGFRDYVETAKLTQKQEQETKTDDDVDIAEFNYHEDDGKVYTSDGKKQVDIASVASIGDNDITFALNDGQTESAKSLDMPTNQAVLAQSILDVQKKIGVPLTADIANTLYQGYEQSDSPSVSAYMQDAQTVLFNGYANNTAPDSSINLPQELRNQLYSMGRQLAASHTQAQQQNVNARVKGNKSRKGTVTFQDGINRNKLDPRRRAGVDAVEHLSQSLGFDVVFYRSTKDGKGRFSSEYVRKNKFVADGQQAPSGFWRGGKMYLDINAGMNGEGLILFTASHELVHMIREGSPEDFKALSDFLVQNYAEQGVDINDLVRKEMARSTNLTRDQALEEVIAESCETFLRDTTLNDKAQELYKQNPTLWSRIREALKRIVDAVKQWYAVARPQSEEARITNRADVETLENAYDLWTKGIVKSAENLRNMESERTDTKYQGRAESTDAEYLDAVERGDMETAQRMVDEAAMQWNAYSVDGKSPLKVYHGTLKGGFNKFGGRHDYWYFSNNKEYSNVFAGYKENGEPSHLLKTDTEHFYNPKIYEAYLKIQKPFITDDIDIIEDAFYWDRALPETMRNQGYDALMLKDLSQIIALYPENIKSADTVTYDDNGNVIPLSERFNENNKDIRYQSRDDSDYLSAVERGDMDMAQRMVDEAAKKAGYTPRVLYHGSNSKFNVFLHSESGKSNENASVGFWFTESKQGAENFANSVWYGRDDSPTVYSSYLKLNNPKVYEGSSEKKELEEITESQKKLFAKMNAIGDKYYYEFNRRFSITGVSDWDAFGVLVGKYDKDTQEYYLNNVSEKDRNKLLDDVQKYKKYLNEYNELDNRRQDLFYSDSYEKFRTDIYKLAGMTARDANFGGAGGRAIENKEEIISQFVSQLKEQGFDGIIIKDTRYDSDTMGGKNTQYVVFDSEQIKSADPVTYDDNGNVIPLSERFNENNKDIRYQSRDDSDYLSAVKRGDMDTAQRMVDEAAKAAGAYTQYGSYTPELFYHGTRAEGFTEFRYSRNNQTGTDYGKAFYFTTDYEKAAGYAYDISKDSRVNDYKAERDRLTKEFLKSPTTENKERLKKHHETLYEIIDGDNNGGLQEGTEVKSTYLFMKNPLIVDANGEYYYKVYPDYFKAAKQLGSDGIVVHNVVDNPRGKARPITVGIVFESNQIKSADPVTYDDDGKVIPLSQRFDSTKTDIRYQSRDDDLFSTDDMFDDDSISSTVAREYITHHEDIGEVLKNIADIELPSSKVQSIVNRVIRNELGYLDEEARRTLSIELQLALERVSKTDAQDISNEMINAVRKAVEGARITDERTQTSYQELRNVFKGKKYFLSDEQINQLKEHDMTFDDFRKAMFGKVTIVKRENAKRSINGGYADAQQLSLEGLHDVLDNPEEILGIRRDEWDNKNFDAPYIIKNAFDTLREQQSQLVTDMYSDEAIDDMAIAIAAKITGDIVEAKYNSRKNPYVSKLVKDLQAKRTEAVNKQKERNKQKLAELKTKERERAEKREQDLKKKYQEQRDRNREGRKRTELRGKIRKLTDSLQRRLTAPKGKQYVPRELISQTVDVLNAVNLDSGRSTRLSEKLAALRNEYDKLKEREESYAMYDGVISNMLLGLSDSVGNTPIMNMTLSQLKQVYDVIRSMDYVIRESVKMTDTNFKKETHQIGRDWIAEIKAVPKEHVGLLSGYVQTMLSAERFFNRIAGFKKNSTSSQLFDMLNKGQLAQTQYEMEFTQIFADLIQDKQLKSLYDTKNLVDIGLEDEDGNKVPITRGMMLSLYMHLLNEDNTRHVMGGGLTVPNMKDYYKGDVKKAFGNGMKSVRVGALDYSQYAEGIKSVIERQLTEYEIKWIEAAQEFFDVASRKALNETTMKLYGFRRANVNNYFPIHTDSNYRAPSFENIAKDMSLENSGFMKERVKASNPIYLEDIVDVINDQISKVAKYCGMTLPIRNFQKVYGTTTHDFESSVQRELNRKFSASKKNAGATKYIDNLLTDLTSGRSTDDGFIARMMGRARGNLAQATLTLNPRVAIAQAASYPTAAAVIGWEPLFKALRKGGKNNTVFSRADREEIAEISPLLWKRTQGYSNVEIGDIKELRKQRHQVEGKLKKAMGWIEFFDGMTVGRLFYACQYYVDEQNPELKRGTAEYNAKVADVYNKVIERTQPNYTTLQRPDILRNPNALIKSLSMFMTQRLQNFNILYDAAGTYNRYLKDYKKGLNGVTAEDVKGARTTLIRSVTSQLVAAGTIVGMKLFADVLLHSMNAYRDDDDELTAESVSLKLLDNFADTLFGSVLFGSDLYSLLKSAISGSRYYGISLSGVDSLVDAVTNIVNLRKGITLESANKAATSICQLFGIPLNNAEKIGKAVYYWASDISGGEAFESGVNRTIKQNLHRYETRLNSGEADKANELLTAMLDDKMSQGKTEKEAKSWLRGRFTATYKQRYIDATNNNDAEEVKNIREILLSTGLYGSLSEQDKTLKKWLE